MIEFWLTDNRVELFRQSLSDGLYQLGRASENDLTVSSPHISRNHLQINVTGRQLLITDLGSTNGFRLNGRQMPPHRAFTVSPDDQVEIGPLRLHFQVREPAPQRPSVAHSQPPAASQFSGSAAGGITVHCSQAQPKSYDLRGGALTIGRGLDNNMRLLQPDVAEQQALVRLSGAQVEIIPLTGRPPVAKNGVPIPVNEPTPWAQNESLLIGGAGFVYTPLRASTVVQPEERPGWLWTAGGLGLMGFLVLCLVSVVIFVLVRGDGSDGNGTIRENNGSATPTLAPIRAGELAVTRSDGEVVIVTVTPPPTSVTECEPLEISQNEGFLDLPFPYQGIESISGGSADVFRRISQRSRFGGRINSFFDHEYPVYPPAFGGLEPPGLELTMVLFDGSRSNDAFVQDANSGDWYSGHSGIDYAPAVARQATTPILAAAAGRVHLVIVYNDGNHAVWLTHDPDGDGIYQYATLYFHLARDDFWNELVNRYSTATANGEFLTVEQGERIGTMGTTGRSTGVHLHFEVRHDVHPPAGIFDRFEKVDPYGFFPGDIESDPWSEAVDWVDAFGVERNHSGMVSDYLWIHPLVEIDAADAEVSCVAEISFAADIRGLIGWSVVDPGFTIAIRDENGNVVAEGEPQTRRLTIRADEVEGVNLETISLEYFDASAGRQGVWVTVGGKDGLSQREDGNYTYTAEVTRSGQYILTAEQDFDFVAPLTTIELSGVAVDGAYNRYRGTVIITLTAIDSGLPAPSGVDTIEYSLDCGTSWERYEGPFTLNSEDMGGCGSGEDDNSIQLGSDELLILASASDKNGNIEQPASQVFIAVQP